MIGTADLCALFFRRAAKILNDNSRVGLIATNTISQGDTRQTSLAVLIRMGFAIQFANRFVRWPGMANVEVSLLCLQKAGQATSKILDGVEVSFISSRLDSEPEAEPQRLRMNLDKSFQGSILQGIGFVLSPQEAEDLIYQDKKNKDCLFRYLGGEDLNSEPDHIPTRWVINFFDWPLERAEEYPGLLDIVRERVKPARDQIKRDRNRLRWWIYAENRPGLYRTIKPLSRCSYRVL